MSLPGATAAIAPTIARRVYFAIVAADSRSDAARANRIAASADFGEHRGFARGLECSRTGSRPDSQRFDKRRDVGHAFALDALAPSVRQRAFVALAAAGADRNDRRARDRHNDSRMCATATRVRPRRRDRPC